MEGRRKALIVANDKYERAGLRNLRAPAADADALGRVLGDRRIGDFAVQVVRNRPAHVIQAQIEELFTESRSDDLLLLHFSCHGLKSESGELFFAAANTRPDRLGSTAVPADFVQRCMRASRSRAVVLLLDCCYGGAFAHGVRVRAAGDVNVLDSFPHERLGGGRGRAVITACSAMEYAFEGDHLTEDRRARPSVFTAALVEGLATGEADRNEDGWVSLNELYDYVFDKVRERNPHQTPRRDVDMEGELYLARSPRRRNPAAPPPAGPWATMTTPNMFTRLGMVGALRSQLASDDLAAAKAAHEALTEIARTDIQSVADAATAAARDAAVCPARTELRFGQVSQGAAAPHQTVRLLGPALARACVPRPSHDWIRVDQTAGGLDISIDTTRAGALRGSVDLTGPTGEAAIAIEVDLVPPAPQALRPGPQVLPSADHRFPAWPQAASLPIAQSVRPSRSWWHSRGVLSAACAAALVIGGGIFTVLRNSAGGAATQSAGSGGGPALTAPRCTTATAKAAAQAGRQITPASRFVPVPGVSGTGKPWGVQATSRYLFVSTGNSVQVFRNNGNLAPTSVRSIPAVGAQAGQAIAVSKEGSLLIATTSNGAFVISIANAGTGAANPIRKLVSRDGSRAVEAAISRDGHYAFVTLQYSQAVAVFDLWQALKGGFTSHPVGSISFTLQPVGIAASPDGKWLYVTSTRRSNGNDPGEGMLSVISVPRAEHTRGSSRAAVVRTVRAGCSPARVITSKDGSVVWVTARQSNALLGFSAENLRKDPSHALIAKVAVGANPIGLALIDDGQQIVVGDSDKNHLRDAAANLAIVSTAKALAGQPALVGVIRSGRLPRELVLEPDGKTLLVTNENSRQLQIVDVAKLP